MMDLGMPVTLVVKAPNQKIDDQTIECGLSWSIKDLKDHISNVYPSKPRRHHQKLIYSGRLLNDNLLLKDVLRTYDEEPNVHTVHLVCAQANGDYHKPAPSKSNESSASSPTPSPSASSEGLRRRATPGAPSTPATPSTPDPAPIPSTTTTTTPTPPAYNHMYQQMYGNMYGQQYYQGMMSPPGMSPGMAAPGMASPAMAAPSMASPAMAAMSPAMMGLSMEQMMWMQQMYAQQMAQYMQLYQAGGMPATPPPTPHAPNQTPPAHAPGAGGGQGGNQRGARGDQGGMVMNAQGGMIADDDDEEMNRDWLDWTYTFTRVAVLLSIVYFYSTFSRFLMVFGLFVAAYMYQAGWFGVQRRNADDDQQQQDMQQQPEEQQQPQQQDDEPPPEAEPQPQPEEPEDAPVAPEDATGEAASDDVDGAAVVEEERPRVLAVAWSFFYTFFSSLVPEAPAAVNAN